MKAENEEGGSEERKKREKEEGKERMSEKERPSKAPNAISIFASPPPHCPV